ncbi:MAG: hypothetical protein ACLFQ7_11795 [Phormidium sp.]
MSDRPVSDRDIPDNPPQLIQASAQTIPRDQAPSDLAPGTRLQVRLIIDIDGGATVAFVLKQPGDQRLGPEYERFAQAIVNNWRFSPASNDEAGPVMSNLDLDLLIESP